MRLNSTDNSTHNRIILGDSRDMSELGNESVHLVVTSPPYWQLKDYGNEQQIGFHQTYEEYINDLNLVWQECYRVLHNGCRLCINIGDQFARANYYGRYKIVPIRTEIIKFCEIIGLDYMGSIIWQKATTMNSSGGASVMGSYPYPRNGVVKLDYEFILIFKKHGEPPKISKGIKESSAMSREEWNSWFVGHWNFPGERQKEHLAAFPLELPRRLIKMFSFQGETVLDPFLGSGTTSLAAIDNGRNSVGYEINRDFVPIINSRLIPSPLLDGDKTAIDLYIREAEDYDKDAKLAKLPYVFKDPVKIDKQVDPRERTYGSKISMESRKRQATSQGLQQVYKVKQPRRI